MSAVTSITGRAIPLRGDDIDTDRIIPARYLRCVTFDGLGEHVFKDEQDASHPFNQDRYRGATILFVGENFGCGSSREHAPWALLDFGIRCVIAPSFADIFYNNCFQNGILPIALPQAEIDKLMEDAERGANATVTIDLEKQEIRGPDGGCITFEIDPFRKHRLLNGLDDIKLTLQNEQKISDFETARKQSQIWR